MKASLSFNILFSFMLMVLFTFNDVLIIFGHLLRRGVDVYHIHKIATIFLFNFNQFKILRIKDI